MTIRVGANEIINIKVMKHEPSDTYDFQRLERAVIVKGWLAFSSVRMKNFVDPVHKVPVDPLIILFEQFVLTAPIHSTLCDCDWCETVYINSADSSSEVQIIFLQGQILIKFYFLLKHSYKPYA